MLNPIASLAPCLCHGHPATFVGRGTTGV